MMAACLLAVMLLAKGAILWGRALPLSAWAPVAFFWQDVLVVLLFLAFEKALKRRWPVYIVYAALVLIVLANVPVARVLSSPITTPMLRAARGAMTDSFRYHATPGNLVATVSVLLLAVGLPLLGRIARSPSAPRPLDRKFGRVGRLGIVAAVSIVLLGPVATDRVDTAGLERNPLVALVRTSVPRVHAQPADADFRASPFDSDTAEDLLALRGAAAGHNVLLVVLESTAARYLQPYGAAEDPTPNLTALARRSIVFQNAYSVYPESIKGLVALLAARYPGFDVAAERHARIMTPSLASSLAAAGYQTALFHSGRFFYLGMAELLARSGFARLEDAGDIGGNHASSFGIDEAAAVQRILQWIDARPRQQRFFAAYLPIAGHHPYESKRAGPFPVGLEIDRYRNALHEGDLALGELLAGLRARGLDRSTLVIVVGDHGEAFGQHAGNYGHNLAIYDENVRVPFLIALPADQRERRIQRVASLLDVAPTALDLLGLGAPSAFQGESLLPGTRRMALFFTDYSLGLLGLRDGCHKVIHELESDRSRVFDLCVDPDETRDLARQQSERVASYRARLRQWSAAEVARVAQ